MTIGEYLKKLRVKRGLSQRGLAMKMNVSNASISDIERGNQNPKIELLALFAEALNEDLEKLIAIKQGKDHSYNLDKDLIEVDLSMKIPLVGSVSAGMPELAVDLNDGYILLDRNHFSSEKTYFALKIKGDSMDRLFSEGSIVIVEKATMVDSGQIAVVAINGDEATVKRVTFADGNIALIPESNNPAHTTKVYDVIKDEVHILGRVIQSIIYF